MRALTSILLALLLTVTSVTFAAARVQAAGLTQMVICAQGAARVVTFDAAGNPVEPPHHCPDCLAALPPIPSPATLPSHRVPARPILLAPLAKVRHSSALSPKSGVTRPAMRTRAGTVPLSSARTR